MLDVTPMVQILLIKMSSLTEDANLDVFQQIMDLF